MLRTSRSKLQSKWDPQDLRAEISSSKDLEGAIFSQNPRRTNRSKFTLLYSRTCVVKTILFISMLFFVLSPLLRSKTDVERGNKLRLRASPGRQDYATPSMFSNVTRSAPIAKPLQISSLFNPPRIDKAKLLARFARLEAQFPDEDLREETDAVADDIRQTYGLSRWPPLISHIPSLSSHSHENYTVETADILFCSTTPCKVLLPVWVQPLSPSQQMIQMQQIVKMTERLNRTLVLPNVGQTNSTTGETLLGIGTCQRHPFARYFDSSKLLLSPFRRENNQASKPVVPNQPFSEWVKYRPVHPSAQVVVVDSSPSNDTHDAFFAIKGAEFRIDEQAESGRGRLKNCLSSKASKLAFGNRPTLIISPSKEPATTDTNSNAENASVDTPDWNSMYLEGLVAFLTGGASASDELCSDTSSESCSTSARHLIFDDPDVLVVEWGLGPAQVAYDFSTEAKNVEDVLLGYSPRLHSLAARILDTLHRPLLMLRLKAESAINSSDIPEYTSQANLRGLVAEFESFLQGMRPSLGSGERTSEAKSTAVDGESDADVLSSNSTDTREPLQKLGTIWLDHRLTRCADQLTSAEDVGSGEATGYAHEGTCELLDVKPSGALGEALSTHLPGDIFEGFSKTNISSAILLLETQNSIGMASLVKQGIFQDRLTRLILEDIIEKHADRVFTVQNEDTRNGRMKILM